MIYCLNPDCQNPQNPDGCKFCQTCGTKLRPLLRNRYRIIQRLGAGGFGRTFLAEDVDKLDERCVVKQLAPKTESTRALEKATELFQQEARRLQQLGEHPQIPTLYAYFEEDKRLYLVQQLIEGQNLLQELAKQGVFSEQKIWELLLDVLPMLKFIHQHNVIHRDIKPENIIRRQSDGKLVLIDFGVAKQWTESMIGSPGTSIGTLGYASIEQMQGGEAYPASDFYSLGVTCFQLLTQTDPHYLFINNGYEWVRNWRQYLNNHLSDKLNYILEKLLQKNMQQRYQSADEILQDLNSQPSLLPISSVLSQTQIPVTSQPLTQLPLTSQPFTQLSSTSQPLTQSLPESPPVLRKPAQQFKYQLLVGGVILLLGSGVGYWYWQNYGSPRTLKGHSGEVNTVAISADGQILASGSDDQTVKLWNLKQRQEIRTLKGHSDLVYSVAISPDSQTLVSSSKDNTVKVWNLKTGKDVRNLKGHKSYVNSVAISLDNQTIASGSYDTTIKIWNLKTGQLIRTMTGHSSTVLCVSLSPNGQTLASGSADQTIKLWNLNTGKELRTLIGHSGDINSIAFSPDGKTLASGSDDKSVRVWNPNTGRAVRTFTGHLGDINSIAFSPDGQTLASGGDDKTIKLWNLTTGEELPTIRGHLDSVYSVTFSPNGKFLVSGSKDKTIKIWRVP